MLKFIATIKNKANDTLLDHPHLKNWSVWTGKFIVEIISAFIFAYGFRAFISPTLNCVQHWVSADTTYVQSLISGGASGISQAIIKFIEIFPSVNLIEWEKTLISILYFLINVPLLLLSYFKISKQFTIFTLINVGFVSLFNQIIPDSWIYNVINIYDDLLARTIFGGITTGISSGLAVLVGTSSGGVDIISIYISERKSTNVGKYSTFANCMTVICYVIFSVIALTTNPVYANSNQDSNTIVTTALYTLVYFFVSGKVIDVLNTKHRKIELQIFTSSEILPQVLIRAFPHSCTIVESKGAYTGRKNTILYMVISRSERKKAVKMIRAVDKLSFITVIDLYQVYGRFYIKPIE